MIPVAGPRVSIARTGKPDARRGSFPIKRVGLFAPGGCRQRPCGMVPQGPAHHNRVGGSRQEFKLFAGGRNDAAPRQGLGVRAIG